MRKCPRRFLYHRSFVTRRYPLEEKQQSPGADGLCRGTQVSDLLIPAAVRHQCDPGTFPLRFPVPNHPGGHCGGPQLRTGHAHRPQRLDGGGICGAVHRDLCLRSDEFPPVGLPYRRKYPQGADGPYCRAALGFHRGDRQRKNSPHRQRQQRGHRNLSGPPASRYVGGGHHAGVHDRHAVSV